MTYVSDDRWTCPEAGCNRTFVFRLHGESLVIERIATQSRHAQEHRSLKSRARAIRLSRYTAA
jgi:hypothetical protein